MEDKRMKWYQVDHQLTKVKGFYFIGFAALGCLFPFIPLYMKAIGLSKLQAGIVFGVMPFALFVVQPTMGVIADKFQKHKMCVSICCVFTAVCYNLIQLVPPSNIKFTLVKTAANCGKSGTFISDCNRHSDDNILNQLCPLKFEMYYRNEQTRVSRRPHDLNESEKYNKNDFLYKTLHDNIDLDCSLNCYHEDESQSKYHDVMCLGNTTSTIDNNKCLISIRNDSKLRLLKFKTLPSSYYGQQYTANTKHTCNRFKINLLEFQGKRYRYLYCLQNATLSCEMFCRPIGSCIENAADNLSTSSFWLFFFLLLLGNIGYAPILSLLDAIVYDVLGSEKRHEWGKQRLWGNISLALFAVISGAVMDKLKTEQNNSYFQFSFYGYGILFFGLALTLCFSRISATIVCGGVIRGAIQMLKDGKRLVFMVVILYFGILAGGIEAFLFWFLEAELENTLKIIPGLCMFCNCTGEIILFYFSGRIINRIGRLRCLYIAFIAYFIRLFSYSFLTNAWFVLPIELLNGVTFSLMWAAATSYGSIIAPSGLLGTMQGVLNGVYFGFAKGVGSLVTGELYTEIGIRWTFRLYGIISLVLLIVYILLNTLVFYESTEHQNGLSTNQIDLAAVTNDISKNTIENCKSPDPQANDEDDQFYCEESHFNLRN